MILMGLISCSVSPIKIDAQDVALLSGFVALLYTGAISQLDASAHNRLLDS